MVSTRAMLQSLNCAARLHAGGAEDELTEVIWVFAHGPAGARPPPQDRVPGASLHGRAKRAPRGVAGWARGGSAELARRARVRCSLPCPVLGERRIGVSDAPPAPDRTLDTRRRFRPARRGGTRGRCSRCRLDPCRRHGRPFRAQHLDRPRRGQGASPAHQEGARRAPHDRALRSLSRSLRQGRLRHHHRACGSEPARAPLAAARSARSAGRRV